MVLLVFWGGGGGLLSLLLPSAWSSLWWWLSPFWRLMPLQIGVVVGATGRSWGLPFGAVGGDGLGGADDGGDGKCAVNEPGPVVRVVLDN